MAKDPRNARRPASGGANRNAPGRAAAAEVLERFPSKEFKKIFGKKKYYPLLVLIVLLLAAIVYVIGAIFADNSVLYAGEEAYPLRVAFVDVGQGDGIVVECGDTVVVIDGGEREAAGAMSAYLDERGIFEVDCYIATHPHSDHIGAIPDILKTVQVRDFMMTSFSELNTPTTRTYERMLDAVEDEGSRILFVSGGQDYVYGDLTLHVLAPLEETANYNNMSVVVRMEYKDVAFLFTGDAEKEVENMLLQQGAVLRSNVLKLGHHGSSTSSTYSFVAAVAPQAAVASCGRENEYGHPHRETLELMEELDIPLYRTDQFGTVVICSDGKDVYFPKEAG